MVQVGYATAIMVMWLNNANHWVTSCPKIILTTVLIILNAPSIAFGAALPPPTGPYQVGVRKYTIEHYNDHDAVAPNNVSTAFLATVFYPTTQIPKGELKPYLNPETATYYEEHWNYTSGTLASITSTVQWDAPFLETDGSSYPTILFGPGGGGTPVEGSTILLSELASYGYAVIGLDHPFEQPFIRFPNGTGVVGLLDDESWITAEQIYDTRLEDNAVFLDLHLSKLVRELKLPFGTTHLGAFGYSIGGAAALGSAQDSSRLVSGLNLDGTFVGKPALNGSAADLRKPAFLVGSAGHMPVEGGDPTWISFPRWQTAYQRFILINGTTHLDLCDNTFWKTLESDLDHFAGPIDGLEMVKVLNAYVKAFFDLTLLGRNSPILDGPSPEFPEVEYLNVSGVS
ncbi:hypothetical protein F4820DRAFT_438591 [Hypoxylon rubiginosum]|uniref:Uncharacterized protein n=1 Tax=Hypoxylon rubiginosum TaxID=110542 RepID=A0ACB9YL75_9PEZI|nr:hypothetical protein F4820DRAFT_438591 [Hypoxylon rubiginosum]